ncbi:MAG: hypothetical protein GEV08_23220 [Acidimicrobiia bacterium]|nr:hypothetical protein [Acidimicrobiia bacterium]
MVAFVTSIIIGIVALAVPFRWALRRRPVGAPLSWGQAMLGATWAFFLMFWWYGVVPHQWLTWADNELNWRADKTLLGPGEILDTVTPSTSATWSCGTSSSSASTVSPSPATSWSG